MRHQLMIISLVTKERTPAEINWLDANEKKFGYSFTEGPFKGHGDVVDFDDHEQYELVRIE